MFMKLEMLSVNVILLPPFSKILFIKTETWIEKKILSFFIGTSALSFGRSPYCVTIIMISFLDMKVHIIPLTEVLIKLLMQLIINIFVLTLAFEIILYLKI